MHKGITLILLLTLLSSCFATELPIKKDSYELTQTELDNMLAAGEHLAAHAFTPEENQQLQDWAIELFRNHENTAAVMSGFNKYQRYLDKVQAQPETEQQAKIRHEFYREMTFRWSFPRYREGQLVLPDIIRQYNPQLDAQVQAEKQQYLWEQQLLSGVLLQQLQLNQQLFNSAMHAYQEHADNITQSIDDMSTRHSLGITGGRILEQHPDHFLVEGENGARYTIPR